MRILRATEGESIYKIAAECGIAPQLLKEITGIEGRFLREGREVGVYTPSRCYTVRTGDTLESVARRFSVGERELICLNPELTSGKLYRGQYLLLRLCETRVGVGVVNGYVYRGCGEARLRAVLPYLNTLTVAGARAKGGSITLDPSVSGAARLAREGGVMPYLRIYVDTLTGSEGSELIIGAVMLAKAHGYRGIIFGGIGRLGRAACELTLEARRRTMDAGLILGVEASVGGDAEYTEYADICILTYDKLHLPEPPSLEDGERKEITAHSERYEVSGAMLDLPAFAIGSRGYLSREEVILSADRRGGAFEHIEGGGYMRVVRGRQRAICESSENARERINIASECGMLGVSFDIARLPFSEIYMTAAMLHRPANPPEEAEPMLNCRGEEVNGTTA